MPRRHLTSLLTCAALLGFVPEADAYVRTKTCDPTGINSKMCAPGRQAMPIYWADRCVTYFVHRRGSDDFAREGGELPERLLAIVQASFETWNGPGCSDLQLVYGGLTCSKQIGVEDRGVFGGEQNLVIWRESGWDHARSAIAVTTVTSSSKTGEIRDADIELNGEAFTFVDLDLEDPSLQMQYADVRNTLTHEVGHLLGLGHELMVLEATMYPDSGNGEVKKRDLHPDDVDGLCSIYPAAASGPSGSRCQPLQLDDRTCSVEIGGTTNCAQAPAGPARGPGRPRAPAGPLLMLIGVGWLRRRTRG